MARSTTAPSKGRYLAAALQSRHRYCAARFPKPLALPANVSAGRARLIRQNANKWLNGSTLRYYFYDKPAKWVGSAPDKAVVRRAFAAWKALGIGLSFVEVKKADEADIRIAFQKRDGSWSYIGTDVRTPRPDPRTMNFGWSLTENPQEGFDTALHEIGHTLGFPHEHQNPFAGLVWNESAVYAALAAEPNNWSKSVTFHNIIEKIQPDTVQGSKWDPNSVMHYPFEAGLIEKPLKYRQGLTPAGGLSDRDRKWALEFYPAIGPKQPLALVPLKSVGLKLKNGQQAQYRLKPGKTADFELRTFGAADTVLAIYELGKPAKKLIAQDNDSGQERNASIRHRLVKDRQYEVVVRLNYKEDSGSTALMAWEA